MDDTIHVGNHEIVTKIFSGAHFGDMLAIFTTILNFLLGFAAITAIITLVINIAKLARSGDNPANREIAQHNIAISGICLCAIGSFGALYALAIMFVF